MFTVTTHSRKAFLPYNWGSLLPCEVNPIRGSSAVQAPTFRTCHQAAKTKPRNRSANFAQLSRPDYSATCRPERANAFTAGTSIACRRLHREPTAVSCLSRLRCSGNRLRDFVPAYVNDPAQERKATMSQNVLRVEQAQRIGDRTGRPEASAPHGGLRTRFA
jgi:hypothetical protein